LDTTSIIAALEAEQDRLDQAIAALRGKRRESGKPANGRKRRLSAAARKRISEAQKKRWAERKKKRA
jgi:excinuclease UvrABC nuclease subunit